MKINALIVDDENDSRSVLKKLLQKFCPSINVLDEAANVESGYKKIIALNPDVVFLDIQMPGGDGFSLLKKFTEIPFDVVFVTSYDKYAIEAIRFSALDYLLKPIEVNDLLQAVKKLEQKHIRKDWRQQQLVNVIFNMEKNGLEKKFTVHYNDSVKLLSLAEISYLEAERNYTTIYTVKKEKYNSSKNLGEFDEMLADYPEFLRISKSHIVNINFINNYSKGEPCILTMENGQSFEISRRKKQEFLERVRKPV